VSIGELAIAAPPVVSAHALARSRSRTAEVEDDVNREIHGQS
jgi:hypothetical protein